MTKHKNTKTKEFKEYNLLSPCCEAPVKKKVLNEYNGRQEAVFICEKDKKVIEPHLLIREDFKKKQVEEIKKVFKRAQE